MLIPLLAMVRKDLQLFLTDRRAVIMAFVLPIIIASFFGTIFAGTSNREPAPVPVAIVDEDGSTISKAIVAAASTDKAFTVTTPAAGEARDAVRNGSLSVAVIVPKGFGTASGQAFFGGGAKPELEIDYDPSKATELLMVRGVMTEHIMQAVSAEMFTGASGQKMIDDTLGNLERVNLPDSQRQALRQLLISARGFYGLNQAVSESSERPRGFTMPYLVKEQAMTARAEVAYNGYAHSFAGMGVQFLLFSMIDLGIGVLLERQRGLWKRLRSAPISRLTLLGGKAMSGALIALLTLLVSFGFAIAVFGVRVSGSIVGFVAVAIACALMAASFGLLIASLGRTPSGSRGLASLAVMVMVMLGGAWVPTFIFPQWLQRFTLIIPARWAVDGLDAMTWRGLGLQAAVMPTAVLLGFAILFAAIAIHRFRWEEQ